MFFLKPIWACGKPGYTPLGRVHTSPFVAHFACKHQKPGFTPLASIYVPFGAYLGLYDRKSWFYTPVRACMFLLEPIWGCMPSNPGCVPMSMCVRPLGCPFGTVENLDLRPNVSMHVPLLAP